MRQPINKKIVPKKTNVRKKHSPQKDKNIKIGTSKLEDRFAKEFLDKLGFEYVRQYEAKDIKRFYDFAIKEKNGATIALIEVDGDYW